MTKKEFIKMLKSVPNEAEIMLVSDWEKCIDGHPELCCANEFEITYDEPQGIGDNGAILCYLYYNPDK